MLLKYPNYKDSGVEWIGEIPEGWEVRKLKYVASVKYGLGQPPKEKSDGLPIIRATNVYRGKIDINNLVFVDPDDVPYERDPILRENDIIVVRSGAYTADSAIIPKEFDGAIAGYDMVVRCESVKSKFISYCLLSDYVLKKQLLLHSLRAAQPHLNREELSETIFALPTIPEQTDIASFLQCKTAELDQLISNKEKLITLYEEEKTAIINRAVTKGLDPQEMLSCPSSSIGHSALESGFPITPSGMTSTTTKLKPSGVEWLGDIPELWRVTRLKYLISRLESGVSVNATDYPASGEEFGILKTSCVYNYDFNPNENKAIWPDELNRAKVSPLKGSIIISRMNTPDLVGASGYVEKDYLTLFLPDRLWQTVFWQDVDIDAKWLSYVLKSSRFRELLSVTATGTSPSMKNLGQEEFLDICMPFMDMAEQSAIVAHIETECSRLNTIINKFEKQIDLFKEYRTTLISEVVTGKIDVRGEVAV